MELNLHLESFDGPMELLLSLIEKNKIDIYDIPIALVTDQYMDYLNQMDSEKMDNMSEFIVMASKLLKIKSRMLLPKDNTEEDEEDPRDELVARLIEYKLFKQLALKLNEKQREAGTRYYGEGDNKMLEKVKCDVPINLTEILKGVTSSLLDETYKDLIRRAEVKPDKARSVVAKAVYVETFKIEEKMEYIQNLLRINKRIAFKGMFRKNSTRAEVVVTFMAMLELIKNACVRAEQEYAFGEIMIYGV